MKTTKKYLNPLLLAAILLSATTKAFYREANQDWNEEVCVAWSKMCHSHWTANCDKMAQICGHPFDWHKAELVKECHSGLRDCQGNMRDHHCQAGEAYCLKHGVKLEPFWYQNRDSIDHCEDLMESLIMKYDRKRFGEYYTCRAKQGTWVGLPEISACEKKIDACTRSDNPKSELCGAASKFCKTEVNVSQQFFIERSCLAVRRRCLLKWLPHCETDALFCSQFHVMFLKKRKAHNAHSDHKKHKKGSSGTDHDAHHHQSKAVKFNQGECEKLKNSCSKTWTQACTSKRKMCGFTNQKLKPLCQNWGKKCQKTWTTDCNKNFHKCSNEADLGFLFKSKAHESQCKAINKSCNSHWQISCYKDLKICSEIGYIYKIPTVVMNCYKLAVADKCVHEELSQCHKQLEKPCISKGFEKGDILRISCHRRKQLCEHVWSEECGKEAKECFELGVQFIESAVEVDGHEELGEEGGDHEMVKEGERLISIHAKGLYELN